MKFSRHPAPGVSPGAPRRQVFEAKVSAYLSAPALTAFLDGAVGASIDDGGPGAKEDRRIEVSFRDAGNDGIDGVTGPPAVSNVVSLRIFPDLSPLKGPGGGKSPRHGRGDGRDRGGAGVEAGAGPVAERGITG